MSEIPTINVAEALRRMLGDQVLCGSTHLNTKEQYDKLKWADERPKPTWKALTAWWDANILSVYEAAEIEAKITAKTAEIARAEAVAALIEDGELDGKAEDFIKIGG